VRSFFATLLSLTLPAGAGPGDGRLVYGADIPAELQTYYSNQVTACELFYASSGPAGFDNYFYTAYFEPIAGFPNVAHGWYDQGNAAILEFDVINFASAGNGALWSIGAANGTDSVVEVGIGNSLRTPNATVESWTFRQSMTLAAKGPTTIDELRHVYSQTVTASTTSSTSYGNLTNIAGVAFVAPASGIVSIFFSANLRTNDATGAASAAPRVGTGSTVGAGTQVLAATDDNSVSFDQHATVSEGVQSANHILVSGLTRGDTYNVSIQGRRAGAAGTASFSRLTTLVIPSP